MDIIVGLGGIGCRRIESTFRRMSESRERNIGTMVSIAVEREKRIRAFTQKLFEELDFACELQRVLIALEDDETFIKNGDLWIDVTASNVSKGNAIIKMLEYLNVDLKDSIRIGDDLNDLPMFLDEGVNVAVSNAFPKLKEYADYITDSCENSGVSKVIDKILNNEL